jgi:hypothetical protein
VSGGGGVDTYLIILDRSRRRPSQTGPNVVQWLFNDMYNDPLIQKSSVGENVSRQISW